MPDTTATPAFSPQQLTASPIVIPPLADGEIWVGIGSTGRQIHHVILLPGDMDDADWEAAKAWAKERGGELPTRVEQALLWAECKDAFKRAWYWSNEQHASNPSFAWMQNFGYGGQYYLDVDNSYRARAVRRVIC